MRGSLALFVVLNALWANCELVNNEVKCDSITNESVAFEITRNASVLRPKNSGNLSISGGSLNLAFAPSITIFYMTATLDISGGSVSINYDKDGTHSGTFDLQSNAQLNLSGGAFSSNVITNQSTTNGININGGSFTAGHLLNNAKLSLTNGTLKVKTLENSGTADFSGGNSEIVSLINSANLNITNGTNSITNLANSGGTASISGGTNTIATLQNSANLNIGGVKNDITSFINRAGSANINSGTNTIATLQNSANLNISGGTNTITTFLHTNGTANISGGTNKITEMLNSANLNISNGTNTIQKSLYNYGTLQNSATLTLETSANLYNYGTISGSGKFSGGTFNHYGNFSNFSGSFSSDLVFNNFANLTIKSGGDLENLNIKSFGNYDSTSQLILESSISAQGFTNGTLASFIIKSGGTLTINTGGTQTILCNDSSNCACPNGQTTCVMNLVAQNAGGFFTLENGGKVDSKIDFSNTSYLTINGGEFSASKLTNDNNGVITLKNGTLKGNIENISGNVSMSGGTIENTLTNKGTFALNSGEIKGAITNEGGEFSISGGTTSGTFTNKVREETNTDGSKSYRKANLIILGNAKIDSLNNQGTNSIISIQGGTLNSANLTNQGAIYAIYGSLNATTLLNNDGGSIIAQSGGSIIAQSFSWGNGTVYYINGNNGLLDFKNITISNESTLNMDFSNSPLIFGAEYKVIKSTSNPTNLTSLKITSNVENNLSSNANLAFNKSYKDGYIVISTAISNTNASLKSLLSTSALQILGETTNQLNALKRIDNNEVLSNIISNPTRIANELKNSNESIAKNYIKSSHLNLATSLNTLNRLNKHSTPKKLAFGDIKPNYDFANKKPKNPLVRFANIGEQPVLRLPFVDSLHLGESLDSRESQNPIECYECHENFANHTMIKWIRANYIDVDVSINSADSANLRESSDTFSLEDLKAEHKAEVEAAKLKYNQALDYANNLYAQIFGIFGSFGGIKTNAYGVVAGYDRKILDDLILGVNFSYANLPKSHNIALGGYGRAFLLNNEIDFGLNFNYARTEYATQMLGSTQNAKFNSFGLNANMIYGYLFNVYKTQFFKPFIGANLYYATTPSYNESGKYARSIDSSHSVEMSIDLGAEYRLFLKRYYYLFVQIRFEQFILNASNGLNMSFVGDSEKFEFSQYKGYKNYVQFLVGGDFAVIKDMLNITANVGYKMTIAKSSIKILETKREINESYISASVGLKYLF